MEFATVMKTHLRAAIVMVKNYPRQVLVAMEYATMAKKPLALMIVNSAVAGLIQMTAEMESVIMVKIIQTVLTTALPKMTVEMASVIMAKKPLAPMIASNLAMTNAHLNIFQMVMAIVFMTVDI
jgi:hypothetical protein